MKKIIFVLFFSFLIAKSIVAQSDAQKFKTAFDAFNQGQFIEAYTNFEKFISEYKVKDELYSEAKFYSSESLFLLNQFDNAIAGYEFFINNYSWSIYKEKAIYRLAVIYFDKKNYTKCRYYINILSNDYKENEYKETISYMLAQTYYEEKDFKNAITAFQQAIEIAKGSKNAPRSYFGTALSFQALENYETAIKYYDTLLTYHKNSPLAFQAQLQIGICYFKLKDFETSILELSNPLLASENSERYPESLFILASSYYKSNDFLNAEKTYNELITKYNASKLERESVYGLAWSKFQLKKYNEALSLFETLASTGFDTIAINSAFRIATCNRYLDKLDESIQKYDLFLSTYPESYLSFEAFAEIGIIYFLKNDYDKAEIFFIKALESNDSTLLSRMNLLISQIKISKHSYSEALELLDRTLKFSNISVDIRNQAKFSLGVTYYFLKKYEESISQFNWLQLNEPDHSPGKVNFYLAEGLLAMGKYQEAIDKYNLIESSDSTLMKETLYSKGYSYFYLKDYDTAIEIFSEFLKQFPNNNKDNDVRLRIGDCHYGNKQYQLALDIYKDVINNSKSKLNSPSALYQYCEILFRAGKSDEAIEQLNSLEAKYPNTEYSYKSAYLKGWIYFKAEKYLNAIESYQEILAKYPESPIIPLVYYSLGDAYYNSGKFEEAIINYKKIISTYSSSQYFLDAISGIQYCYESLGVPDQATSIIDEYIAANSGSKQSDQLLYKKGEILFNARLYEQAKNNFSLFIEVYPASKLLPDAYYMLAKSFHNLQIKEEEIANLKILVTQFPHNEVSFNAVTDLTALYNADKMYDSSIAAYDLMLLNAKEHPRASELLYQKGLTLANKGDVNAALDVFVETMQNYQGTIFSDKAMFEIALIQLAAEQYEFAEKYFNNLGNTRIDELGAVSQYNYGFTLFKQKKYQEAASAFEKVLSKFANFNEWNTKASLKLADTYILLKDKNKAKELYKIVLKKHTKDIYGKEAKQKLENIK